jgi:glycosyltransferase involved in cell wall biosynthesis
VHRRAAGLTRAATVVHKARPVAARARHDRVWGEERMTSEKPAKPFKHPKVTGTLISKDPPIVLGGLHGRVGDFPLGSASLDAFLRNERPMYFFFCPQWSLTSEAYLRDNVAVLADRMKRFPQHTFTVLVNDPTDLILLKKALPALNVFVWNTNCTADVSLFAGPPAEAVEPEFDAVYIARFSAYKRLELAAEVERLCLVTRAVGPDQVAALRAILPQAYVPNIGEDGQPRVLAPKQVAGILQRSRCGLMLSGIEGQTRSIMEYLLCGLPVVTTPNYGGRDRFLTPSNSLFAAPDPVSVAASVNLVPHVGFDPPAIRAEALRAMEIERKLLVDIVNAVIGRNGERALRFEDLHLPHKTSSAVYRLDYYFTELGYAVPSPDDFVTAGVPAAS